MSQPVPKVTQTEKKTVGHFGFYYFTDVQEICESETFSAACAQDEVILAESAQYGRMRLGRCVKTNLGFVGCSTDVLHITDQWCSGRRICRIPITDPRLQNTKPCPKELKSYLEISYQCVKGESNTRGVQKVHAKFSQGPSYSRWLKFVVCRLSVNLD